MSIINKLAKYSDTLRRIGYEKQAKAVGLLASRLMLDATNMIDNQIKARDIRVGMVLAGVGRLTGFGAPGSYGEVKYIHTQDKNLVISVYAPQVEDNFELVLAPHKKVRVLTVTKPLQRKALRLKAKTLLASLACELEDHELGPQLARLNYKLTI